MSWEQRQQTSVFVYTLHVEQTTMAWAYGFKNLIIPGQFAGFAGMPFDHGRNSAVSVALQNGFEWIFSLDSDVIPPRDAILKLLARKQPITSGVYHRRSPPHGIPVAISKGQWLSPQLPENSLIEVDFVGAGCLLVHRTVFERLPHQAPGYPYYHWRVNMTGLIPNGENLSEDFTWCKHVREKGGYKILLDTGVQCKHVGLAEAGPASLIPLNTTHQT